MPHDSMKTTTEATTPQIADHHLDIVDEFMLELLPEWLRDYWILFESGKSDSEEVNLICSALQFAYDLHKGQFRKSGEPYITHPIAVATLLKELGADKTVIAAGFLHDVVEDTSITSEEIGTRFGEEVRQLVDGVTKLSKEFDEEKSQRISKSERQAENLRRMFIAMAKDIRVVVVKLADRLHNMRTLEHMSREKQYSIAKETLEIFAPLANRLGIGQFKWELEDLSFKYLEPDAYEQMRQLVSEKRTDREIRLQDISALILDGLQKQGINVVEIQTRPKHLYSIYNKMRRQSKEFSEIYDLAAIRVIVSSNAECYLALAVIHSLFSPIPQRFKDYIGLPKSNNYQSLHTTVIGLNVKPVEVQIRTQEMHEMAEKGIAAHWKYKESGKSTKLNSQDAKFIWLRSLLEPPKDAKESQENSHDPQEYMESIKDNLFEEDIYVFTPKGDIIFLPRQATPVDFAYRIHTEVGNHIKSVKINDKQSSLSEPLQNGDIVEVVTSDNNHPNLYWLNFVVTHAARNRIRQWHKNNRREENILRGRDLLEKELSRKYLESKIKSKELQEVAERMNYHAIEDLYAAIAHTEVKPINIYNKLREIEAKNKPVVENQNTAVSPYILPPRETTSDAKCPILGINGLLYRMARCCNPLPGEPIVGIIAIRPGPVSVHCQGCLNAENTPSERQIPLQWDSVKLKEDKSVYAVDLLIDAIERVGLLKDILARVSERNINVRNAGIRPRRRGQFVAIYLQLEVHSREELDSIMSQIKGMKDVAGIMRLNNHSQDTSKSS